MDISSFLPYLTLDSLSPMMQEIADVISYIAIDGDFPWTIKSFKFNNYTISKRGKQVPVMLQNYVQDMCTFEISYLAMMFSDFNLDDFIQFRRTMLERGYFSEILKVKSIKDVIFHKILNQGGEYTTVMFRKMGQYLEWDLKNGFHLLLSKKM